MSKFNKHNNGIDGNESIVLDSNFYINLIKAISINDCNNTYFKIKQNYLDLHKTNIYIFDIIYKETNNILKIMEDSIDLNKLLKTYPINKILLIKNNRLNREIDSMYLNISKKNPTLAKKWIFKKYKTKLYSDPSSNKRKMIKYLQKNGISKPNISDMSIKKLKDLTCELEENKIQSLYPINLGKYTNRLFENMKNDRIIIKLVMQLTIDNNVIFITSDDDFLLFKKLLAKLSNHKLKIFHPEDLVDFIE